MTASRAPWSARNHGADAPPLTERRAAGDPGLRVVTHPRSRTAGHTPPVESPVVPPGPAPASRRARTRDDEVPPRPTGTDQSDPFSAFGSRSAGTAYAGRRPRTAATVSEDVTGAGSAAAVGETQAVPRARARAAVPPAPDPTPQHWTDTGEGAGAVRLRRRDRDGRAAGGPGLAVADDGTNARRAPGVLSGVRESFGHLGDARFSRSVSALDDRPSRGLTLSAPVLGAIVAGIVALVVVGALLLRPGNGADPTTALVPPATPQQETVLVTLLGEDETVARAMLLAIGPGPSGAGDVVESVLVPGDLTVPVPDAGSLPFSQSITVDAQAPDRAVEDLLGVRVDGTWVMDAALLADHVDTAGGVEVDVAAAVVSGDVTVPVGTDQLLTGAQATAYASAPIDGEEPQALLARFAQVMLGLVEAVPQEPGEVTQLLSQVDRHPATTATSEQLSRILAEASALMAAQGLPASAAVPTTGGADSPLVADREAVEVLVGERLSGARLPESVVGPLDVVVGNAVGDPGLVTAARDRLVEAGFRFAGGGTLEGDAAPATTVLVPEDTPENRERGLAVAAALGVPADALFVKADFTADVPEGTDIIVWLGQDYVAGSSGEGGSQ